VIFKDAVSLEVADAVLL